MSNYPPMANQYFDDTRGSTNHLQSASELGSAYELRRLGDSRYTSQASMTMSLYGSRSVLSMYTPSQASYILPVVTDAPDPIKKPADNWGFACCSVFINPLFGLIAVLLAEMSKDYFNRCKYIQASKYGSYAKGAAAGGIASTIIVLLLIIAQVLHYQLKFNY
ncbi:uncharacterized protein LOC110442407 [Mizuhopecten yessoensis]|uniref:Uncharacterized protein n=1 Tax=Mizuhopecten yessoensis TaxID=6573 RepID=A0A210PHA5_MIZYE|nr:uncharacterized protein LOC110442407 [Mizuhopecten yessoensis]OWF35865.1 hypothetical protein KP79_PYT04946 [Mizuhopecten yessoensis]